MSTSSWSANQSLLAIRYPRSVYICDPVRNTVRAFREDLDGADHTVALSPDATELAYSDHGLQISNLDSGESMELLDKEHPVRVVTFSPDGGYLAAAGRAIWIFDMKSKRLVSTLRGHTAEINDLEFTPDGRVLVSVSSDRTVRLWSVEGAEAPLGLLTHDHASYAPTVGFSADGKSVFWSDARRVGVWRTDTGSEILHQSLQQMIFRSGRLRRLREGEIRPDVRALAFDPSLHRLLIYYQERTQRGKKNEHVLLLWNTKTEGVIKRFKNIGPSTRAARFSPDREEIVIASSDRSLRVLDPGTGRCRLALGDERSWALALSPRNSAIAATLGESGVQVWDLDREELVCHLGGIERPEDVSRLGGRALEFHPDGHWVAASIHNEIYIWDLGSEAVVTVLKGHGQPIRSLAFSPDGTRLVSGSEDHTIRVWSTVNFDCLATLTGHLEPVGGLAFSPDGETLVSAGENVLLWNTKPPRHPGWTETKR